MKKTLLLFTVVLSSYLLWLGDAPLLAAEKASAVPAGRGGEMAGSIWVVAPSGILSGNFGTLAAPKNFAEEALVQNRIATEDLQEERWLDAIRHTSAAIAIEPQMTDALINRSWAYIEKGLYQQAIADCNAVLQMAPESAAAFNNLGLVYQRQNMLAEAAPYYRQACQLGEKTGCANLQQLQKVADELVKESAAYFAQGKFDKVVESANQAIALDPNLAQAYVNRSGANANLGNYTPAIEDARKAIALDAKNCLAFNNLAFGQEQSGDASLAGVNYEISCSLGCSIGCRNRQRLGGMAEVKAQREK